MSKTVSQILTELKQSELVDLLTPEILSNYLLILSAFINQAGGNIIMAEKSYSEAWIIKREDTKTDKQADVVMKITNEYQELQKAKYAEKALIEIIRSIKKVLVIKIEESHNQF